MGRKNQCAWAFSPHTEGVFESLFERSADAIWLYDPEIDMLLDCNQAAVKLMGQKVSSNLCRRG